jgi:8-oxo-dGTP pyrophosphatase MutT (NUDIX family)
LYNGEVYFLLGKEKYEKHWDGSRKWSDFGGGPDGQPPQTAAAREAYEESMGFLGSEAMIKKRLKTELRFKMPYGYVYLYPMGFRPELVPLYNRVYTYSRRCNKCPEGWLEKTEIRWFSARELWNAWNDNWNDEDGPEPVFRPEFLSSTIPTLLTTYDFKHGLPTKLAKILKKYKL